MSQRTKTIIVSIVVCIVLAGIGIGLYCAWPAIAGTITGNAYYTYEDVQNAYDDGYTDGIRNESELTAQIDYYKGEVDKYIASLAEAQTKIENLEKSLQDAINSGNADKETIAGLQNDLAEAQADILAKQEQIQALQNSITYYQELLEAYQDADKLIVTFTLFDNGVETVYDVQTVDENGYLTAVVNPTASDFEGWALTKGGELIDDLTTVQVTENMTIYGMFTNTVTFMVKDAEYTTQEVSYNKYATDVEISIAGFTFDGWSLTENGETISLNTTPITADTTFYAVLEKKDDLEKITWNGLTNFDGIYVWSDGDDVYYSYHTQQYVLNKETSAWEEKIWNGATNFEGLYIWTDGTDIYNTYATTRLILDKETDTWNRLEWDYLTTPNGYFIWTDGENTYYSDSDIYNKATQSWSNKVWYGLTDFDARNIWTNGANYYYSNGNEQYQLDKETSTWQEKTWTGLTSFNGQYIWTDGVNYYYSNGSDQYIINF